MGERKQHVVGGCMKVEIDKSGTNLTLAIEGRIDTLTAPKLEEVILAQLSGVTNLTLDFSKVEYISSAGLRVLLSTSKKLTDKENMIITHASKSVMEVFQITGFLDILNIQ